MTFTTTELDQLQSALLFLAGNDFDLATEQNGVGFNSQDTKFGNRIARVPASDWSNEIANEVARILPKYHRQLAGAGIDVASLPKFTDDTRYAARDQARAAERKAKNTPYAEVIDGEIHIYNSFSIKNELKGQGYRFNGQRKTWFSKPTDRALGILRDLEIEVPEVEEVAFVPSTKPEVLYDSENEQIIIDCEFGKVPLDVIRSLPGRKWDNVNKVNRCLPDVAVIKVAEDYSLRMSEQAHKAIADMVRKLAASVATETTREVALSDTLRPYQAAGTAYADEHGKIINADDMGLGKTLQTIAAFETRGEFPVLVTCPASLRINWVKEVAKWTPHRTAEVWDGKGEPPATDYVIVSYEGMTKAANS